MSDLGYIHLQVSTHSENLKIAHLLHTDLGTSKTACRVYQVHSI
jgi:hypothetical protein